MDGLSALRPPVGGLPYERTAELHGLKLAIVTGNYNYVKEGANQALNKLARHLIDRLGARVRAYSPVTATPAFAPEGILVPVPSVPLPGRSEFRLALGLPAAIRADLDAFAPDIVHIATPDILGVRAQRFARSRGWPVVASLHTHFERYCDYYRLGMLRPLVERHLDRFYRRSDRILAPTPQVVADFAVQHGARKVSLWSRGVDTRLFHPARRSDLWRASHGIGPDDAALLFFGRLVLEKGVDRFVESVVRLRAGGVPVRPVIVGEGPARSRLAAALPDAVFAGHLAGPSLAIAVASCDVLLNPSLTEAFGNVTLEAMASGLAVVAADVASSCNLIAPGVSGLLASADPEDLVTKTALAITDRGLRAGLARAARARALDFQWDAVLDAVIASYAQTLDRRTQVAP